MSTITFYTFTDKHDVAFLEQIEASKKAASKETQELLGTFLFTRNMLNKQDENFDQDCAVINDYSGVEIAQTGNKSTMAVFKINRNALKADHPKTYERFAEMSKTIPHVHMLCWSKEEIERLQAIQIVYPPEKKTPIGKRILNAAYNFLVK